VWKKGEDFEEIEGYLGGDNLFFLYGKVPQLTSKNFSQGT